SIASKSPMTGSISDCAPTASPGSCASSASMYEPQHESSFSLDAVCARALRRPAARRTEASDHTGRYERVPAAAYRHGARKGDRTGASLAADAGEGGVRNIEGIRGGREDQPVLHESDPPADIACAGDRRGDPGWASAGADDARPTSEGVPARVGGAAEILRHHRLSGLCKRSESSYSAAEDTQDDQPAAGPRGLAADCLAGWQPPLGSALPDRKC